MSLKIMVILLMTFSIVNSQVYDEAHTLSCSQISNDWSFDQNLAFLWNVISLHDIDKYTFLIVCPLVFAMQILMLATFLKFKLYNSSPSDIIFGLFICEMFINCCLFSSAVFHMIYSQNNPMPTAYPYFCMTVAIINTGFSILQQIYLVYFLIHVIFSVKRSIKKNVWFEGKSKHFISIFITLISTGIIWALKWMGLSQLGICEITSTRNNYQQLYFPILQLTFAFLFVAFAFITFRYFKNHMPQSEALNKRKYQENQLITRFTIGMSIILVLLSGAMFILFTNCLSDQPISKMMVFSTIFNLTRMIQFGYLIAVMLTYRKVGNKVKKLFRSAFSSKNDATNVMINQKRLTNIQIHQLHDIGIKQKILDIQQQQNQIDFVTISQIMTILVGISISYKQYFNIHQKYNMAKHLYFHEQISFKIDPKLARQYEHEAHILPRLSMMRGQFTIYAPRVFNDILLQDQIDQIWKSFDLIKNSSQIYKIYQSNGGKSGQFFFFTSDNKYILKTINKQQFNILLEQLQLFYNHFKNYPNTYITKIYGMFTITNTDISQKYYILLMKNISGCGRDQVLRIYDMKGSTHDRQILKQSQTQSQLESNNGIVLKDLDFMKLEGKIEIDQIYAKEMKDQLQADTSFLKHLNIIDYSLLLMRVTWPEPPKTPKFWGKIQRIPSTVCQDEYYQIALIDFLQKWDLQKKSQKWWKNLFGKKDTSAQQPSLYQSRFMRFIKQITTCDSNRVTKTNLSSQIKPTQMARITEYQRLQERQKSEYRPQRYNQSDLRIRSQTNI